MSGIGAGAKTKDPEGNLLAAAVFSLIMVRYSLGSTECWDSSKENWNQRKNHFILGEISVVHFRLEIAKLEKHL